MGSLVAAFMGGPSGPASRPGPQAARWHPAPRGQRRCAPSVRRRRARQDAAHLRAQRLGVSGFRGSSPRRRPRQHARHWRLVVRGRRHRGSRCRPTDHRQIGDRGGAGAADHQLRLRHAGGQVGKEGLHLGGQARRGIDCGDARGILGAGLVADAQVGAQRVRAGPPARTGPRPTGSARPGCRRSPGSPSGAAGRDVGGPARSCTAARTGLPVWRASTPAGRAVGHVPQATASTRRANSALTRPRTPFCSWIATGVRVSSAAATAGIDG